MTIVTHVAVAVIENDSNEVCISLRHQDAHQGGLWEFPGGKVENGESVEQSLFREIKEELGLEIKSHRPLITITHTYEGSKPATVCLHVYKITSYKGVAEGLEGQQVEWVKTSRLTDYDFPAANLAIIRALQLPDKYLITGRFNDGKDFSEKLDNALSADIRLVQLRLKDDSVSDVKLLQAIVEQAADSCNKAGAKLMLNLSVKCRQHVDLTGIEFAGFHADSRMLMQLSQAPSAKLFSSSCHNKEEIDRAVKLNSDFIVLSPVQKTASHPEMEAMGWQQFSSLIKDIPIPVYALGGVSGDDIETAWSHGAQGVAAISAFWK